MPTLTYRSSNAAMLTALATALKLSDPNDIALQNAVAAMLKHLGTGVTYSFDGVELRVLSASRADEDIWHVTTACACTCESGWRPWCWHRAFFRLLLAGVAIKQPRRLQAHIAMQTVGQVLLTPNPDRDAPPVAQPEFEFRD